MNATNDRRPRALLLDDDPVVLRLVGTALQARGFDVRAAADGEGGVALLLDELLELDVVVADLDLTGRDAWSLLHLVRRAGGERELAVVVVGGADPRVHGQLLALGADAVVDRADGPAAVVAAARAVVAARRRGVTAWLGAAAPAIRDALLVARAAVGPPLRTAPAGA